MLHLIGKIIFITLLVNSFVASANEDEQTQPYAMNNDRMDEIIRRLDDKVQGKKGYWQFKIGTLVATVITDEKADRMRIIIPIIEADKLDKDYLYRLMQANFDSALDARYAIAKEILWSTYLHPLSILDDEQFITAIGQTVNLVSTFGSSYTSGLLSFRGGDSQAIQEKQLIQELLDKGRAI